MSYLPYVIAAYAVFVLVIAGDWLVGHLAIRRHLRSWRKPPAMRRTQPRAPDAMELER